MMYAQNVKRELINAVLNVLFQLKHVYKIINYSISVTENHKNQHRKSEILREQSIKI